MTASTFYPVGTATAGDAVISSVGDDRVVTSVTKQGVCTR
jgi:hypothetical protein